MTTILRIGAKPQPFKGQGTFIDGETAAVHRAELSIDEGSERLVIRAAGVKAQGWTLSDIRQLRDQAGGDLMILRHKDDPTARLILTGAEERRILLARAPDLHRAPKVERKGRLLAWALGAVASVAVIIFGLIPFLADNLAEVLPPEGEKALGDTTFEQIRSALDETGFAPLAICDGNAAAVVALAKMQITLADAAGLETELTVAILDHPMVNAFALPGGYIVFFRGLIDEAGSAEEVAAVFAHEMGHVAARDPARIALRSAGSIGVLGLLFGDFAGGALVLLLTERMIQADYTQDAEGAADDYAHSVLLAAGVNPMALATFFDRLREKYGETDGLMQHFMSHPSLGDRIEAARDAAPEGASFQPILTADEWAALQSACPVDPAEETWPLDADDLLPPLKDETGQDTDAAVTEDE